MMSRTDQLPEYLEGGEEARLIPPGKSNQRENQATSILLAGISAIYPLAKSLLGGIGQKIGNRSRLDCYTQVTFKNGNGEGKYRPDGLIELIHGQRIWRAIVESKIGKESLDAEQIQAYIQIAKANNINSVITISNQFASLPTHHPVKIGRTLPRGISLYHWSWAHILTTAMLQLDSDELSSKEQQYLLKEFIRYFQHPATGVERFTQMNVEWKDIVTQIQQGTALNQRNDQVLNTVAAWHQETRDLCLHLTESLKQKVRLHLSRKHAIDPKSRLMDGAKRLKEEFQLAAILEVPNAAADIELIADIRRRTVTVCMTIEAPEDKKTAKARVNWLLRQLRHTNKTDDIIIIANWPNRKITSEAALEDIRENPDLLSPPVPGLAPRSFCIKLISDIAVKFSGRRTFIEAVEKCVPHFYREVGQHLRAWVPPPPKSPPETQNNRLKTSVPEISDPTPSSPAIESND